MKRTVIKGVIVACVFFMALFMANRLMNQENADMTMEMGEATYPVVTVDYNGYLINEMHGYARAMEVSQMRESITPLMEGRKIRLQIDTYGQKVSGISFEVRSPDGERLVENTQVEDFEQSGDKISVSFGLKDLIEQNQEYLLVLVLTVGGGKEIRYYTRVVSTEEYFAEEKIQFVDNFSAKTFDREAARELTIYMETNADGDNTSYGHVDIHSSFRQMTWGDLDVTRESEANITIKELASQTGSFWVEYYVSYMEGLKKNYCKVREFYRIRHTEERIFLLDYERTMNQIFRAESDAYANNKILLGIVGGEVPLEESDGGNNLAFVVENRLYSYNVTDNKMVLLFGFYDEENQDRRTLYGAHGIKILNVDEGGNVTFLVYGYMNRGRHEGEVGTSLYYYDSSVNTVEELVYLPCQESQYLLMQEVEQLAYLNRGSMLYLKWRDRIYAINVMNRSCTAVVEHLAEGSYRVSDSNKMAVWQKDGKPGLGKELVLMNLTTGRQKSITAGAGEVIGPVGFMGEDLIYGIARESDIVRDYAGNLIVPMYCVRIENETEQILLNYQQENVYVTEGIVNGNQINLSRVEKNDDGTYTQIRDDQIMNSKTESESRNTIERVITESYEKLTQIALRGTIDKASMKYLTPREVLFEGGRSIILAEEEHEKENRYYVYGKSGLESLHTDERSAVNQAEAISGVVLGEDGSYVWMRGNRSIRNQIMAIQGDGITEEKNSLAVCLDTMMEFEGIIRNAEYMLKRGESVLSILEENLPDAEVLDLTGCSLDSVLYYVNQDIPVLAMLQDGSAVLIIGFNELNTVVMNPEAEDGNYVYKVGMNDSREWFEQNGNRFITYVRKRN
ncbi:MAG: hypothetical protein K2P30_06100 [Lachnospiraceae bacterium]|nr:hypothetical protein [Lachnospiraceae bacterium]